MRYGWLLLEAMLATLEDVDGVAPRYRAPVERPKMGSGRRRGLTIDCIRAGFANG